MTVLVECTHVFFNPEVNSGIQRVVKNIVNKLPEGSDDILPVVLKGDEVFRVRSLYTGVTEGKLLPWSYRFERFGDRMSLFSAGSASGAKGFFSLQWMKRCSYFFCSSLFFVFANITLLLSSLFGSRRRLSLVTVKADDVLVLLDSSWSEGFFSKVDNLHGMGVKVVPVIYDVIPIVHPEFHNERMVNVFQKWFSWTAQVADGYLAISESVVEELKVVLGEQVSRERLDDFWFSSFRLGSDLKPSLDEGGVRSKVKDVYAFDASIFLSVSTIEPRKNYDYQLDAFDKLWADGMDVRLCIVGRVGWHTESLMARINSHSELGRRLFVFHDLGDHELIYCYMHSKALIFTSLAEGFGLPLVEASHYQLPVICSDIPVFREVGGDNVDYCDLDDFCSLIALIKERDSSVCDLNFSKSGCISWEESASELMKKLSFNILVNK